MTRVTVSTAVKREGGVEWTEEEKAEYEAKWKRFVKKFQGRPVKARRTFVGKITELGDPEQKPNRFTGETQTVRRCLAEITESGLDGLRFVLDLTDSGTSVQNTKAKLNHLYTAVHHLTPPEEGRFEWDVDELLDKEILLVIEKGPERADGKRGGIYANLRDFEGFFPDTEEEEEIPA